MQIIWETIDGQEEFLEEFLVGKEICKISFKVLERITGNFIH